MPLPLEQHPTVPRPLLVGHSLSQSWATTQILGGGAACFSVGAYWNEGTGTLHDLDSNGEEAWSLTRYQEREPKLIDHAPQRHSSPFQDSRLLSVIPRVHVGSNLDFENIMSTSQPAIIEDLDIGPCTSLWTMDYLRTKIGSERPVQ